MCFAAISLIAAIAAGGDLDVARQALRDGLWELARAHAAKDDSETARLVILESYAAEDKWDKVKESLSKWGDACVAPAFGYYRAAADGRLEEAATILRASGSVAGAAEARMLEADLRVKAGQLGDAAKLWREVVAMTNAGDRAFAVASMNLGDVSLLRAAYGRNLGLALRRMVGLRLGTELVKTSDGADEGAKLIRAIVADSPDAKGACEAFVALAEYEASAGRLEEAEKIYHDALETWPEAARLAALQEGRGETLMKLGKNEDALKAFSEAETLAADDAAKAVAVLRQGDVLAELGRGAEAMTKYRTVLDRYSQTHVAKRLKKVVELREMETHGRNLYKDYRFDEAKAVFARVAEAEPALRPRMAYFEVLCLYGLGSDDEAVRKADELAKSCPDASIRADTALWLAKFTYNRGEWKRSCALFRAFAAASPSHPSAPDALLWATRAAFAGSDFKLAIQTATALAESHPSAPAVNKALIVQGRALIELARFDEAVLVLERVAKDEATAKDLRLKAQILKADALFAMGADNPARYQAALDTYREISFRGEADSDDRISVAFKIGRTLEKLRRREEAADQYYTRVVLAYRDGRLKGERFGDEARASFSRAAFRLADEYESRGRDRQAISVLRLVVESDVPAAEEAAKRIERISTKGRFL